MERKTTIVYDDGKENMSYTKTICAYRNGTFINESCILCQDQFGETGDISFGDVWLREMKKHPIKHTGLFVLTMHLKCINL